MPTRPSVELTDQIGLLIFHSDYEGFETDNLGFMPQKAMELLCTYPAVKELNSFQTNTLI